MSERDYLKIDNSRDALAVLSLKVYKKFGKSTLPLIEEICSRLGQAVGAKMKILQSLAGNDGCCEIIYGLKNER